MEASFPLLFAAFVGFSHAFEADHLVAVSSIVTRRERLLLAVKDGIYWGLGHTSTIVLIGLIMIIGRATFLDGLFGYFEATVGLMLVILGFYRLYQYRQNDGQSEQHDHPHEHQHHLAYGIGLVHGLAGSGAMILLVMTEVQGNVNSLLYLLIFGIGSIIGMLVAAGIFSLPFSRKITSNEFLKMGLVLLSSFLCIGYGLYVIIENL
ncbi:urease accessory protein [Flavilitoribacter nigricans]|uniref:Urease accessory protein n=1 Tax=Flavilitoribacter nigricans (strain ATCC 23147 / DSM 23189 / NBRC 102662 / NCIMB 1420 / SS-2) TaxID=1122177 RepID=A0A2D0N6Q4_FLAN2|nr:urease accessory protein [Flavilitoribacter nigricans]PHN03829.1 urease accessory protein [Flavilitoribacter nigricans DSM 23189 = NBRC 102662]